MNPQEDEPLDAGLRAFGCEVLRFTTFRFGTGLRFTTFFRFGLDFTTLFCFGLAFFFALDVTLDCLGAAAPGSDRGGETGALDDGITATGCLDSASSRYFLKVSSNEPPELGLGAAVTVG